MKLAERQSDGITGRVARKTNFCSVYSWRIDFYSLSLAPNLNFVRTYIHMKLYYYILSEFSERRYIFFNK